MGLGKTIELIGYLASMKHSGIFTSPFLIVAPTTVLSNWARELNKWCPTLRVLVLHAAGGAMRAGRSRAELLALAVQEKCVVVLTTFGCLRNKTDLLAPLQWSGVALDEGHRIRNPHAEVSIAARSLRTPHRYLLTGAPLQNSLLELWALFDWIMPGKLGSRFAFDEMFSIPIKQGGCVCVVTVCAAARAPRDGSRRAACCSHRGVAARRLLRASECAALCCAAFLAIVFASAFLCSSARRSCPYGPSAHPSSSARSVFLPPFLFFCGRYTNASAVDSAVARQRCVALRQMVAPFLLRRLKLEVGKGKALPPKTEEILFCPLTEEQITAYLDVTNSRGVREIVRGESKMFAAISLLRQICNHPDLARRSAQFSAHSGGAFEELDDFGAPARSGKMLVLQRILPIWQREGHKCLLFSQSTKMLNIIELFLRSEGFDYVRMDGTTSIAKRQGMVDRFNDERSRTFVFLLTSKVGGVGVNLTGANRVILYDPDWNPSTDLQSRERCWRIGQKRPVTIYRLISEGTIEEKMYQRQVFKTSLNNQVLAGDKHKGRFTAGGLKDLFTLRIGAEQGGTETDQIFSSEATVAPSSSEASVENGSVMSALFEGGDIKSVFSHDVVEGSNRLEVEAKKRADVAVVALQRSTAASKATGRGVVGSSSLLQRMNARKKQLARADAHKARDDGAQGAPLLRAIVKFVGREERSAAQIVRHFSSENDPALFRQLLRQCCERHGNMWRLKPGWGKQFTL